MKSQCLKERCCAFKFSPLKKRRGWRDGWSQIEFTPQVCWRQAIRIILSQQASVAIKSIVILRVYYTVLPDRILAYRGREYCKMACMACFPHEWFTELIWQSYCVCLNIILSHFLFSLLIMWVIWEMHIQSCACGLGLSLIIASVVIIVFFNYLWQF